MRIKNFLWLLFWALALLGLIMLLLFRLQRETKVLEAIAPQAVGVVYLPTASKFKEHVDYASWWPSLQKAVFFDDLSNDLALLDTMLNMSGLTRSDKDISSAFALLELSDGESGFVFYAGVGRSFPYWDLHEKALPGFDKRFELIKRKTAGYDTFLLIDRRSRRQLNYAFQSGLAIASFNREAFEQALISFNKRIDNNLKLPEQKAAAADAIIFVHPARLSALLSDLFTGHWTDALSNTAGRLDTWIILDLYVRENELMLNGLLDQHPVFNIVDNDKRLNINILKQVMPINTLSFRSWYQNDDSLAGSLSDLSGLVVEGMAVVSGSYKPFILFLPERPEAFTAIIYNRQPRIPSVWNGFWAAPVDVDKLAGDIIGNDFNNLRERSFVTSDGRLFLFSSDLLLLRNYIETRGKGLINSDINKLSEAVAAQSGLMLYHQLSKAAGRLAEVSGNALKYRLLRDAAALHGFESVSVQLSRANDKIYLSALVRGNETPVGQAIPLWSARLDAPGAAAPFIFKSEMDGRIIAFDSIGGMYGFSSDGRRLWKRQIGAIPLGEPFLIDYPGLKRPFFLFNTSASVFMVDANGNPAQGFPFVLPSRATSALTYAEKNSYNFYVNCADRRTYAFNLNGKSVAEWTSPLLTDISAIPPTVLTAGEATYVMITTMDGTLKILDNKGLERIRLREPLQNAEGANIYLNRTNARSLFITSGQKGELIFIGSNGINRSPGPEIFSQGHYFHYADFDADQSPDFMYADGRRVVIFDRYNRVIIEGMLPYEIRQKPVFVEGRGNAGIWCFDQARSGHAATVSAESGFLNFFGLPKGEKYGFGRISAAGPLMLAGYEQNGLILFSIN